MSARTIAGAILALAALVRAAWAERALSRLWTALAASTLLLLLFKAHPFGVDQDVALPAAPLNLGFALATYHLRAEARAKLPQLHPA